MPDLRDRFRDLDSLDVPDVMTRAHQMGPKAPIGPGPSRGRRVAIAVFALIVGIVPILATLLLIDRSPEPDPAVPARTCRFHQTRYELPNLGGNATLATGTSRTDLWVVEGKDAGAGPSLLHFDGTTWNEVDLPTSPVKAIEAIAPNDLWLLGNHAVFRFDGVRWERILAIAAARSLSDLDVTSDGDAWVTGNVWRPREYGFILHWDGSTWRRTFLGGVNDQSWRIQAAGLRAVSAWGPTDVWAVGYANVGPDQAGDIRPLVMHWDGSAWALVRMRDRLPGPDYGHDTDDVVATGPSASLVATSQGVFAREATRWVDTNFHDGSRYGWMLAAAGNGVWALTNSMRGNEVSRWDGLAWRSEQVGEPGKDKPWAYGIGAVGDSALVVGGAFYDDRPPAAVLFDC